MQNQVESLSKTHGQLGLLSKWILLIPKYQHGRHIYQFSQSDHTTGLVKLVEHTALSLCLGSTNHRWLISSPRRTLQPCLPLHLETSLGHAGHQPCAISMLDQSPTSLRCVGLTIDHARLLSQVTMVGYKTVTNRLREAYPVIIAPTYIE